MNRNIIRHGFVLILLSLVGGLLLPAMSIPRLGLSAHTIGLLSGVLLLALGAIRNDDACRSRASAPAPNH